jgi:oxygen-independent coproporphyrinogen-3 oxidase
MPGVYISYPFCSQKCTYCNFASGVFPRELEARYINALLMEIRGAEWNWMPETLYFGGGTPSLLAPERLCDLLNAVPGRSRAEVTIEAAPGGITPALAHAWRQSGVDRVSLGVQSFVARELNRTGRKHTAEIVREEVAALRSAGIVNLNLDLIAGLPGQTAASWNESLDWIERLEPPHVSVYMLEVDEDSRLGAEVLAFGKRYGARDVPAEEQIADCYEAAVERLGRIGIPRYEISNFARPGWESRHNLKYWKREPYRGFGADAHSFDGEWRWQNVESPAAYAALVEAHESPAAARTRADRESEQFFLGLRLMEGIPDRVARAHPAVEELVGKGLLERSAGRLRLTSRGVLLSNEVFAEFIGEPVP